MPPLGTAPRRVAPGVWVTRTGRNLTAAGSAYWENEYKAGRTDGKGHMATPSVVTRQAQPKQVQPRQPQAKQAKPAGVRQKPLTLAQRQAASNKLDPLFRQPASKTGQTISQLVAQGKGEASGQLIGKQGVNYHQGSTNLADVLPARYPGLESLFEKSAASAPTVNPLVGAIISGFNPVPHITDALAYGDASPGGIAADLALLGIAPLRGLKGAAAALKAIRAGEEAGTVLKTGAQVYRESTPILDAAKAAAQKLERFRGRNQPARFLTHNQVEQQLPRARSIITQKAIENPADRLSTRLQASERVRNTPLARLATSGERVMKAGGKQQERLMIRRAAAMHKHLSALKDFKQGSREDVANFHYAQLPPNERNATGLARVRAMRSEELNRLASGAEGDRLDAELAKVNNLIARHEERQAAGRIPEGGALQRARAQQAALERRVAQAEKKVGKGEFDRGQKKQLAGGSEPLHEGAPRKVTPEGRVLAPKGSANLDRLHAALSVQRDRVAALEARHANLPAEAVTRAQKKLEKSLARLRTRAESLQLAKADIPQRIKDLQGSVHVLNDLVAKPPVPNERAIRAAHVLGNDATRIYLEHGVLNPAAVQPRRELVARSLGLEPTGEEAYMPHLMAKPEGRKLGPIKIRGGTGKVHPPAYISKQNKLALYKAAQVRESMRAIGEHWQEAQAFEHAGLARDFFSKAGDPLRTTRMPEGRNILINSKGTPVPAEFKLGEFAHIGDSYKDLPKFRQDVEKMVNGYVAATPADQERMIKEALDNGQKLSDLRVLPERYVDRYYSQIKRLKGRGKGLAAYDMMVDAVASSIVFARIGYIPKNIVQNLIMAAPHQGAFLPQNAAKWTQVLADPELRAYALAEISHTGATGALSREAGFQKVLGKIAGGVSHIADDPLRGAAYMHELQAWGVIPRLHALMTEADKQKLLDYFRHESTVKNDVRSSTVEAMGDFSRMTPDQARLARRFLIIPGWLMAGTRYPFHFAATHPIRSALLAYIAMGEPGAPKELRFNKPIDQYFAQGMPSYLEGIPLPNGKYLRTGSIDPVTTPLNLVQEVAGSIRGKQSPFQHPDTVFDSVQPGVGALVRAAQGEGVAKSLEPLVPNEKFIRGMISPQASPTYPGDASRIGRLEREAGVIPIPVDVAHVQASQQGTRSSGILNEQRALQTAFKKAGFQWGSKMQKAFQLGTERAAALDKLVGSKGIAYQQAAFKADIALAAKENLIPPAEEQKALGWAAKQTDPTKIQSARRWMGEHYFGVGLITEAKRYMRKHGYMP